MHRISIGGNFMAAIRPSSDLRNKYNEISDFCNQFNEPVFITKNGTGDLVVLSNAEYERLCGKAELHRLLDEGLFAVKNGNSRPASDVFSDIERKFGFDGV
jgi:prevent-host-death family protein